MTINNPQLQNEKFEKGLKSLRNLSLTPRQKGELFHKLYNYTEARPAPKTSAFYAAFIRALRSVLPVRIK